MRSAAFVFRRFSMLLAPTAGVALAFVVALSTPAAAAVFLNGVNIDGITGQTFENCTVTIDEKGNILIVAKGYEVQASPTRPAPKPLPAATTEPVTKRYFLVTEQNAPGMTQYDIDVFINSVWVKRLASDEPQVVLEVSKHLRKGQNSVHLTATKMMKDGRKSTTPAHVFMVHLGEGNMGGNNVMIDNELVEYKRTAAEVQNFNDDFTIVGR
jgi:hypothetical protein